MTFTNADSGTVVECAYDSMSRRTYTKVSVNGSITLHQRYIYRGYLQIACIDLTRSHHPALWYITWDVTQPVATRPLALQKDGTWYTYGWDLTKNICELYSTGGTLTTAYSYSPFGKVTATGSLTQPIQWSSEVWDSELGLVYYNWRYYNSVISKWTKRDNLHEIKDTNLYRFCSNVAILLYDNLGLAYLKNNKTGKGRYKLILSDSMYIKRKDNIKAEAVTYNIFPKKHNYPKYNKHNSCYDLIFPEVMHVPQVEFSENGLNMHKEIRNGLRKTALSHEEFHVDIGIKHWNNFVDDTKLLEGKYLNKKCAFQALTIVQKN